MTHRLITLALLTQAVLCGCSGESDQLAQVEWVHKNDRDYVATWSVEGIPVVEVTLAYHGKQPDLPFEGPEPTYDWRSRDTDFYRCVIRNLTEHPVQLLELTIEMDSGKRNTTGANSGEYLRERWGSDVIPPGGTVKRRNTWVWGKRHRNNLTKTFKAEILPTARASAEVASTRFAGHDGAPIPFSFQIPMRYER